MTASSYRNGEREGRWDIDEDPTHIALTTFGKPVKSRRTVAKAQWDEGLWRHAGSFLRHALRID
jgi:hypothetical protein